MIMKFLKTIYNDNDIFMMKYCYGSAIAYDDSPIIAQFLCCVYYILSFTLFFLQILFRLLYLKMLMLMVKFTKTNKKKSQKS